MPTLTPQLASEYNQLFNSCIIRSEKFKDVDKIIASILANRPRYETVQREINVPWYFIGIVHSLEGGLDFTTHLHNGDSLKERTKHIPRNRPVTGAPPFLWEVSAIDALQLKSLNTWTDWTIAGLLFQFERFNGFGYRPRGINSPYLWSFCNHYTKGKFVQDGIFSDTAVSKQCGSAVLLRRMSEKQIAITGEVDTISQIKVLGGQVKFSPNRFDQQVVELQKLLNSAGIALRIDGRAGRMTSDAVFAVTGKFLTGDV